MTKNIAKRDGLKGLNPHQLDLWCMLMDGTCNEDHEFEPKMPARMILRSGQVVKGLLAQIHEDGGLTLEHPKKNKKRGFRYVDLREVVVLDW